MQYLPKVKFLFTDREKFIPKQDKKDIKPIEMIGGGGKLSF